MPDDHPGRSAPAFHSEGHRPDWAAAALPDSVYAAADVPAVQRAVGLAESCTSGAIVRVVNGWSARRPGNSQRALRFVAVRMLVRWSRSASNRSATGWGTGVGGSPNRSRTSGPGCRCRRWRGPGCVAGSFFLATAEVTRAAVFPTPSPAEATPRMPRRWTGMGKPAPGQPRDSGSRETDPEHGPEVRYTGRDDTALRFAPPGGLAVGLLLVQTAAEVPRRADRPHPAANRHRDPPRATGTSARSRRRLRSAPPGEPRTHLRLPAWRGSGAKVLPELMGAASRRHAWAGHSGRESQLLSQPTATKAGASAHRRRRDLPRPRRRHPRCRR